MQLAYVDESHDKNEYWIAGIVVPDIHAQELEAALDNVVREAIRKFPNLWKSHDDQIELHGHALAQGTEDWAPLASMLRARLGIYEAALSAIAKVPDLAIVRCGLDRKALARRYGDAALHPHEWSLKFALERIHDVVRLRGDRVLITCDETEDPGRHHANLRVFRTSSTGGFLPRKLTTIVDTLHFASSKHSRLVQAADLVSYIAFRHHTDVLYGREGKAAEGAAKLWAIVESKEARRYRWLP